MLDSLPAVLGTIPGWITAGGIASILGLLLSAQVSNRKLKLAEDNAERTDDAAKRAERRDDLHDCHTRLDLMSVRLDTVEKKAHLFERELNAALTAYRIVEVAHEALAPGSIAVQTARSVLSIAFGERGDSPVPDDMADTLRKV